MKTINCIDFGHLNSLLARLSSERVRFANAKTGGERDLRCVWVMQLEKEVAKEREFLGLPESADSPMDDDTLLAQLSA